MGAIFRCWTCKLHWLQCCFARSVPVQSRPIKTNALPKLFCTRVAMKTPFKFSRVLCLLTMSMFGVICSHAFRTESLRAEDKAADGKGEGEAFTVGEGAVTMKIPAGWTKK